MRRIKNIKLWGWLLFLPLLGGCTTSDDLQAIFTGKTWKMTYISQGKGEQWYEFPDVNPSDYNDYYISKTKSFTITFTGAETDHTISGSFTGGGSVTMDGTWNANGESNAFHAALKNSRVLSSTDKLGQKIVEALTKSDAYGGDEMNLYLYFTYENVRLYIAFTPVK